MSTTLTVAFFVSWLLLFGGLFIYEKLDKRIAVLSVQQEQSMKLLQAIADKVGVEIKEDELTESLTALLQNGKTYEAIVAYRAATGTSVKQAKAYIDFLQKR